jgi:hypothetical protein
MDLTLFDLSGSPYPWRVWLALEHKRIPYQLKNMSFDDGDFKRPAFVALNPRHRVPEIALVQRIGKRKPGPAAAAADPFGPEVSARMSRMETLPVVQKTWPPHWRG